MPTLEEMAAWSADEIEGAVRSELPDNLRLECGYDAGAGAWYIQFWQQGANPPNLLYQDWGFDQRLTYFNGYGWLWAQKRPKPPAHSPWVRRREITLPIVQHTAGVRVVPPDPEDLEPSAVEAVYADLRGHPQKR
jgi:hypothetical protein